MDRVNDALALDRPRPVAGDGPEHAGALALIAVAGALQFSIAIAQILLTVALICWVATLLIRRERVAVPQFFWPLAAYAAATLVSAAFSSEIGRASCRERVQGAGGGRAP